MATLLVPLTFAGLVLICSVWPARQGIREALLRAALLFGAIVVLATEALSLFDALTAASVTVVWLMLAAMVATTTVLVRARSSGPISATLDLSSIPLLTALACATILGGTLVVAVVAPPNYADALSYHMGRVAHWIQARSVDYYPTAIDRQNYQMPFAEFAILHLQLLSGGDRWANVVQWAAFALSGMTVSLALADLGQSTRVQWAGALVAFTIPMAILEASGAQNDLVVSLWLLAFLLYLWRGLSDRSLESSLLCGLALGLALATKGTAYLYAPAMGGVLVAAWLARAPRARRLPPVRNVVIACVVAACFSLGPWYRSMIAYRAPIYRGGGYFMERMTPGDAVSNVLRNAALHLGVPKLTGVVERGVEILSPVDLDDPVTTMGDGEFHLWFSYNEGAAGNTLHLLAFAGAAIVVFVHPRLRRGPARTWLLVAIAGFLAFSLPLVWQRWGSRLHTPVFLVASIPIAIVLGSVRRTLSACVLTLLFAGSLFYVFLNHQRPLLSILHPSIWAHPRDEQYLPEFPEWQAAYERAADFVRASHEPEIGLLFREIDYEYVLWVLAKDDFAGPPRIRHVGVERIRGQPRPAPPPAIVITSRMGERKVIGGFDYVPIHDFGRLRVLRRVGADEPRGTPVPRGSAVQ